MPEEKKQIVGKYVKNLDEVNKRNMPPEGLLLLKADQVVWVFLNNSELIAALEAISITSNITLRGFTVFTWYEISLSKILATAGFYLGLQ